MADDHFLSRWSRRKIEARKPLPPTQSEARPEVPATAAATPSPVTVASASAAAAPLAERAELAPPALPPIESLTLDSDFTAFMQPGVDSALRRQALKTLLHDPSFNVMDGLDVYIDDYSKPDPLPEGWLEKMNQMSHLGDNGPKPEPLEEPPSTQLARSDEMEPGLDGRNGVIAPAEAEAQQRIEAPPSDTSDAVPPLAKQGESAPAQGR